MFYFRVLCLYYKSYKLHCKTHKLINEPTCYILSQLISPILSFHSHFYKMQDAAYTFSQLIYFLFIDFSLKYVTLHILIKLTIKIVALCMQGAYN